MATSDLPGKDAAGPTVWNRSSSVGLAHTGHQANIGPRRHSVPKRNPPSLRTFLRAARTRKASFRQGKPTRPDNHMQRVALRAKRVANTVPAMWRNMAAYLERAIANRERCGFDANAEGVSLVPVVGKWQREGDPCIYKIMISPETAVGDPKQMARDYMAAMERDVSVKLEWLGAIHTNTEHPHVHLLVRGVDRSGAAVVMGPSYLYTTAHTRAREAATNQLGYRGIEPQRSRTNERAQGFTRERATWRKRGR